ncbi:stringent starvation protein B domain protein [Wolbachia pipientis]|uniref:Stringent starvation protein B domain protein n=1 Tax=Wolbachia pipientis TaxID=955 RepID=A0A1E7QJ28_WOLPI|nr:ClpXP protease specificity-enhancing factor SspB [Wolbachia pipientis]OEY86482.1 stringent starvation protein B domain protein [Wolbachia pipientis]
MSIDGYRQSLNSIKFQIIKKALVALSIYNFTPHLEILFFTGSKNVVMPDYLKKLYPNQMLIVLQHQFYNLKVFEDKFSVNLSFNGKQEQMVIPFAAISKFYDKISEDILNFASGKLNNSSDNIISIDKLRSDQ